MKCISTQGYPSVQSFIYLTKDDIAAGLVKVLRHEGIAITLKQAKYLEAMHYWVCGLALTDTVIEPALFNEDLAVEQFRLMISDIIAKDPMDITVEASGKLTNSIPWLNWKETIVAFMNTKTGAARVPFAYVIRDNVISPAGVAYTSDIQRRVHETVHRGPTF